MQIPPMIIRYSYSKAPQPVTDWPHRPGLVTSSSRRCSRRRPTWPDLRASASLLRASLKAFRCVVMLLSCPIPCVLLKASLRCEKRLNFLINPRKLWYFSIIFESKWRPSCYVSLLSHHLCFIGRYNLLRASVSSPSCRKTATLPTRTCSSPKSPWYLVSSWISRIWKRLTPRWGQRKEPGFLLLELGLPYDPKKDWFSR